MKKCSTCGILKTLEEFTKNKINKDGLDYHCKSCKRLNHQKYHEEHKEEIKAYHEDWYHNRGGREKGGHVSMYENKSCSQYLGIVAAERLCKHLFKDVEVMPPNFHGYDLICNKGKKIDVKASTSRIIKNENSTVKRWKFLIKYNKICDFFLCLAFDNVDNLEPEHYWLIPAYELNDKSGVTISSSTIHKWDKWEKDIEDAKSCCNLMKDINVNPNV